MKILRCLVFVLLCVELTACSRAEESSWMEEVQLSNGRTIRVAQNILWRKTYSLTRGPVYRMGYAWISPDPQMPEPNIWQFDGQAEVAVLLDFDPQTNDFVLVTYPRTCERYETGGRPNPPYFEYRPEGETWSRVELSPSLIGRETNMVVVPDPAWKQDFVDLERKRQLRQKLAPHLLKITADAKFGGC